MRTVRRRNWKGIAALLLLAVCLSGCGYRIAPPAEVADPVAVYVIDYGRHASLGLSPDDGHITEWYWGDWNYFAMRNRSLGDGMQALFASEASTLGRRDHFAVTGAEMLRRRTGADAVLKLDVERGRAAALQASLEHRFAGTLETELRHRDGRRFVRDEEDYSLFNNSVHAVAFWLRDLGATVTGYAVTADFALARTGDD